jgi:hypothetical protein
VKALALEVLATLAVEDSATQLHLWDTNMSLNFILEVRD